MKSDDVSTRTACVVNDWQTWEAFADKEKLPAETVFYTESPYLYEKWQKAGLDARSLADLVPADEIQRLSELSVAITRSWKKILDEAYAAELAPVRLGSAFGRFLFLFVNVILFRGAQCAVLAKRHSRAIVPYLEGDTQNLIDGAVKTLVYLHCNYFGLFAQNAARKNSSPFWQAQSLVDSLGSVSKRLPAPPVHLTSVEYWRLLSLRFFGQRSQVFPRLVLQISGKWRHSWPWRRRTALVLTTSDYVFDIFFELARSRYEIRPFSWPEISDASSQIRTKPLAKTLLDSISKLGSEIEKNIWNALETAAHRVEIYVRDHMLGFAEGHLRIASQLGQGALRPLILSNGIYDVEEAVMSQLCESQKIPVISFEHGGMGLTRIDEKAIHFTDKENCTAYVAHNEYEEKYYRERTGDQKKPFYILGAGKLTGARSKGLSRILARKILQVKSDQKLAIYAPTRFREDHIWIGYENHDVGYWHMIKKLMFENFASSGYQFFIKLHQKGWLPSQKEIYSLRRHPLELVETPANVRYGTYPQLNYIRWGADLIIIDRASSTIQWALTRDIPLVYLNFPFNPLEPEVRQAFAEAAFVVDIGAQGEGRESLDRILRMPHDDLKRQWAGMAKAREDFASYYVLGPKKRERNFASWVEGIRV